MHRPGQPDRDTTTIGHIGRLADDVPEASSHLFDRRCCRRAAEIAESAERNAHVLFVDPKVERADLHEAAVRGHPDRCPGHRGEVLVGTSRELGAPCVERVAEADEDLGGCRSRRERKVFAKAVEGGRLLAVGPPTEEQLLDSGKVLHNIAHGPAGAQRRYRPVGRVEIGQQRLRASHARFEPFDCGKTHGCSPRGGAVSFERHGWSRVRLGEC